MAFRVIGAFFYNFLRGKSSILDANKPLPASIISETNVF